MDNGQIILFQTQGGETKIEVRLSNETVWLTADQMAELFQRDRSTIKRHIKRIYDEGELTSDSTCAFFAQVQTEGKRQVERKIPIYNLDMKVSRRQKILARDTAHRPCHSVDSVASLTKC